MTFTTFVPASRTTHGTPFIGLSLPYGPPSCCRGVEATVNLHRAFICSKDLCLRRKMRILRVRVFGCRGRFVYKTFTIHLLEQTPQLSTGSQGPAASVDVSDLDFCLLT